ncbi:hypothetical protein T02_3803 [Trichinella nativa]|uniref:Uncharacterized protein n=1 Tax=Trichinella nativa TaxID=6335 RepID=A0A0V1KNM3_9BILA|nr:hypothetical protein T02_3803 [Trichinella nativa]
MELKEELIDLQTNEELKPKFKDGYHSFCLQKQISGFYLKSSYSPSHLPIYVVTDFLTKKRNRLQIDKRGDLRLFLTNIEPNGGRLKNISLKGAIV